MNFARIAFSTVLIAALAACSGSGTGAGGGGGSGSIQLSPSGTAANPVYESPNGPFELTAAESGYDGDFTAQKISGQCFKVQPPATSAGAWALDPNGLYCIGGTKGDTEAFKVTDASGRSAVTYITTKI